MVFRVVIAGNSHKMTQMVPGMGFFTVAREHSDHRRETNWEFFKSFAPN